MQERNPRMYELEFPAPAITDQGADGPTLIVALQGYADAGHAVDASSAHLLAALDHRLVASFNNDELIDYRSRRPSVTIDRNSVVDMENLELGIQVLKDTNGKAFLLLSGPEPDMRWEAFTEAVADLVERFNVSQTICLYSAPMTVPHTRPMVISAHGNTLELLEPHYKLGSRFSIPGSAALQLERLLNKKGRNVAGYTAHVPHYLAASPYPQATLKLLEAVGDAADLELPLGALEEDAERVAAQIDEQVATSHEIEQVVSLLEQQYDENLDRYREEHPHATVLGELPASPVPTGDELGEEFERFLAELDTQAHDDSEDNEEP
ncbi:MAG: PAC2 family protein [Corynebacterium sp.]|uniref:PAC2 family protein n=1 Tax=Corynebacterium sp. TaxID=1720 RepID=UPI0026DD6200|nr:PAC2 family protein [Corynebacterium sp.]MDO5099141.1 PAC2 family protein [Corynebacterium sp.]